MNLLYSIAQTRVKKYAASAVHRPHDSYAILTWRMINVCR